MHEDQQPSLFRHWRTRMGLSQPQAAQKLGYGISQIASYDRGECRPPLALRLAMNALVNDIPPFSIEDAA